jgi:hypothetical protein
MPSWDLYNVGVDVGRDAMDRTIVATFAFLPKCPSIRIFNRDHLPFSPESQEIPRMAQDFFGVTDYALENQFVVQKITDRALQCSTSPVPLLKDVALQALEVFKRHLAAKLENEIIAATICEPLRTPIIEKLTSQHLGCYRVTTPVSVRDWALNPFRVDENLQQECEGWTWSLGNRYLNPVILGLQHTIDHYHSAMIDNVYQTDPFSQYLRRRAMEGSWDRLEKSPERIQAIGKGDDLLKDLLGESDYSHFKAAGYIDLPSMKDSNVGYRIRGPGRMIGLLKRENGIWVEEKKALCVHPNNAHAFVPGDRISSQVLLCKYDEGLLWSTANVHQLRAA